MAQAGESGAPRNRFRLNRLIAPVSAERRKDVLDDVIDGSAPRLMYYVLLGASVVIAAFGLLANSPAVVIGAMLVSPLMTPIFGVSVGLCRGDMQLLRPALIAEFGGVALALSLAFLLGMLPFSFSVTPEMLARTSPNLLDLFVAAFAGLAGCLAMIDERVSPALPGVAISTSLTPPLAASGLCLAFGAYAGAWGAFLLFFANFLAILAVATTIFIAAGFVRSWELGSVGSLAGRFASPAAGLLVVTVLLTQQLVNVVEDRETDRAIRTVLGQELRDDPSITLEDVLHSNRKEHLEVLATVRAGHVLSPKKVQEVQEALAGQLGRDVALFFRCSITKDVGATGSANLLAQPTLDGRFRATEDSTEARTLQVAEQTLRDVLVDHPNIVLQDVRGVRMPVGLVVVASIQSSRRPIGLQVKRVEDEIRRRLGDVDVRLVVRSIESTDTSDKGRVLHGEVHFGKQSAEDLRAAEGVEALVRTKIEQGGELFVTSIDALKQRSHWDVRAEVAGPGVPKPDQIKAVEATLTRALGSPVKLTLWARSEVVVTAERYASVDALIEEQVRKRMAGAGQLKSAETIQ